MTGKYSIYTLYEGHEIMFHVSTLLPFSRDNRQQVRRLENKCPFSTFLLIFVLHILQTPVYFPVFSSVHSLLSFRFFPQIQKQQLRIICQMNSTNNLCNTYCLPVSCAFKRKANHYHILICLSCSLFLSHFHAKYTITHFVEYVWRHCGCETSCTWTVVYISSLSSTIFFAITTNRVRVWYSYSL